MTLQAALTGGLDLDMLAVCGRGSDVARDPLHPIRRAQGLLSQHLQLALAPKQGPHGLGCQAYAMAPVAS